MNSMKMSKILVIEDEGAIRRLLKISLETASYSFIEAENALSDFL